MSTAVIAHHSGNFGDGSTDVTGSYAERQPLLKSSINSSVLSLDDRSRPRRCLYNMFVLCAAVVLAFTSFNGLQNAQSSLHEEAGVGVHSLACLYVSLIAACFLAPTILKYTGYKWAMSLCFIANALYAGANFYPRFYVLAPACVVLGIGAGAFWTAQGQYVTHMAIKYGEYTDTPPEVTISRFNGLFFMFLQTSQIWGNMILSLVLSPVDPDSRNISYLVNETCGANFHTFENGSNVIPPNAHEPTTLTLNILMGTFLACCLAALLIVAFVLDDVKPQRETLTTPSVKDTLLATVKIHANGCILLLIPLFYFAGMEQILLFGDFTQAFVACELGVGYVGYTMIAFGAVNTVSSFLMGQLDKCSGRMLLILVAAGIDLGLLLVMLEWTPGVGDNDSWLLYFIPGLWAVADSVWQTIVTSLVAVEFAQSLEAAFATFRMWQAAGMGVTFAYSFHTPMRVKLYVMLGMLAFAVTSYLLMELVMKRRSRRPYLDLTVPIRE